MDRILKMILVTIFILFLFTVLMLFIEANSAAISGSLSLWIILALLLGTAIFSFALFTMKLKINELDRIFQAEKEIEKNENTADVIEKEIEKEIDIEPLLPSESTKIDQYTDEVLQKMAETFNIVQGIFYTKQSKKDNFECAATYAYFSDQKPEPFKSGETLPGQSVKNKTLVVLNNVPDNYMTIVSGLGKSAPKQLVFVPIKQQDEVVGVIEYATFETITERQQKALEAISKKIADAIVKLLKK